MRQHRLQVPIDTVQHRPDMMAADPTRAVRRRSAALLVLCTLMWSIAGVFTRHLDAAASFEVTFWRSFFCAVTVVTVLSLRARGNPWQSIRAIGRPGLFSGLMWAVMFTCFMVALTRTSTANTLLVMSIAPLLAAVLGRVVLGERIGPRTAVAIVVAGLGIAWMVREGVSGDGVTGMLIAAGVPLAAAINIVTLKKWHASVDLVPAVLAGSVLSAAITLPFALPWQATGHDLAILALLGAVQLALPCMLYMRVVGHLAPHEIALLSLLEVVFGPIWTWAFAGETITPATLQGGVVVLAALAWSSFSPDRSRR